MEFCHALTQLLMFQPLSGMGGLRMVLKTSLFLPILGIPVSSYCSYFFDGKCLHNEVWRIDRVIINQRKLHNTFVQHSVERTQHRTK
jgi:hypothetical protein